MPLPRIQLTVIVVSAAVAWSPAAARGQLGSASGSGAAPANRDSPDPVDLVVIGDVRPWMVAIACPVLQKLAADGPVPLLIASLQPKPEARLLIEQVQPRGAAVLGASRPQGLKLGRSDVSPEAIPPAMGPLEASCRIAKHYWTTSHEAVLAYVEDPESVILGSALAAHLCQPLILMERDDGAARVAAWLTDLQLRRVVLAAEKPRAQGLLIQALADQVETADLNDLQRRIVSVLGRESIRNIILAHAPNPNSRSDHPAWLSAYLSLARRSAIAFCHSASPAAAETAVRRVIERHGLKPHTLTILGDYALVGTNSVALDPGDDPMGPRGDVETEPCLPTNFGQIATLGVGRVPFVSLEDASVFIARSMARERRADPNPPHAVVVANPALGKVPLPACEVVSRITAEELRNFGVQTEEFYRLPADSPEIVAAVRKADLFLYEGHIEQQDLFPARPLRAAPPAESAVDLVLEGLPIIVLQSCDSLEKGVLRQIDSCGGAAVIGATTPVHSTSGAAFIKALCDGVLYRGQSVGEALRDARNYFFCLQELKDLRGHREQAKSQRVALSFRLWGDPELRVFRAARKPSRRPIAGAGTASTRSS